MELNLRIDDGAETDDVASALRRLAGSHGLTDVVFVGDIDVRRSATGEFSVQAATATELDERRRQELTERAEGTLGR